MDLVDRVDGVDGACSILRPFFLSSVLCLLSSDSYFLTSTSRGFEPSAGPTTPSFSMSSIIRAARL